MLTINEIFHSIQGESTHAGRALRLRAPDRLRPALPLVRHAVCVSRGPEDVDRRGVADVERFGCPLVEVTGGEPLLQHDVYPLMQRLLDARQDRAARNRRPPQHRAGAGRRRSASWTSSARASGESAKNDWSQPGAADRDRRSEVRHQGSRRLRVRARRRRRASSSTAGSPPCCSRRCTACSIAKQLAEWMLADRAAGAAAAAGPQVHLGVARRHDGVSTSASDAQHAALSSC